MRKASKHAANPQCYSYSDVCTVEAGYATECMLSYNTCHMWLIDQSFIQLASCNTEHAGVTAATYSCYWFCLDRFLRTVLTYSECLAAASHVLSLQPALPPSQPEYTNHCAITFSYHAEVSGLMTGIVGRSWQKLQMICADMVQWLVMGIKHDRGPHCILSACHGWLKFLLEAALLLLILFD